MPTSGLSKTILVVDDDESIRNALKKTLQDEGFLVEVAADGLAAQQILGSKRFAVVISDIQMPTSNVNGIELLRFVKKHSPAPVILMTGVSEAVEVSEAFRVGADQFLAKPFRKNELLQAIGCCIVQDPPVVEIPSEEASPQASDFYKLAIDDFTSGRQIKFNIFVQLSPAKFVKIAHEGEDISIDRIRAYKSKGLKYLYLKKEDFQNYIRMSLTLNAALRKSSQISKEKKIHFLKHSNEVVLEYIFSNEFDEGAFENAKTVVENTLTYLMEDLDTFNILSALNSHSDSLYAHSLGVSIYSAMIARHLKWNSHSTLYRISIAGLLHDIGKKEIDPMILKKPRTELTPDEVKLIETHPVKGMEIVTQLPSIPSELAQIILQHHETDIGTGYPSGLTKKRTHPLARLVSAANRFCELVVCGPDGPGMKPSEGLERLKSLQNETLDRVFIEALEQTLKGATPESP